MSATIPRFAPLTGAVLDYQPVESTASTWQGQYVTIPSAEAFNFDTRDDFAVEVWFRLPPDQAYRATEDNAILEKWTNAISPTTPYPFVIRCINAGAIAPLEPGMIVAARYDGVQNPQVHSQKGLNDDQFHYVVFTREKGQLVLYVDGAAVATVPDSTVGTTKNDSALGLGYRYVPPGHAPRERLYFTGSIGQVRIWARAMVAAEVAIRFAQAPLVGWQDGRTLVQDQRLVGDWRCNEGYGPIAYDYALGNHGVLGGPDGEAARPTWTVSTLRLDPLYELTVNQFVTVPGILERSRPADPAPPKPRAPATPPARRPGAQRRRDA